MPIYNCKVEHDCHRITKFDDDMNVESSYLTDGDHCDCPAGARPRCRHRTMLPLFKASRATNGEAFYDFDREVWTASEAEVEFELEQPITFAPMPPLPKGVVMIGLDDPRELHNAIARAVGEPEIAPEPTPSPKSDLRRI